MSDEKVRENNDKDNNVDNIEYQNVDDFQKKYFNQREKIKKLHNGNFEYTLVQEYPRINVKNMLESLQKNIKDYDEWLNKYDSRLKESDIYVEDAYNSELIKKEAEIEKFSGMSKEERIANYEKEFEKLKESILIEKKNKEKILDDIKKKNRDLLNNYKIDYETKLKNSRDNYKKWNKFFNKN